MNKLLLLTITLIVLFLASCKPGVLLVVKNSSYKYHSIYNEIEILEVEDSLPNNIIYLGSITIQHAWKNNKCDYDSVIEIVVDEAHDLGSDLIKIIDHRKDKRFKTCHQIVAEFYRKPE
jgi:hypothetical protein